MKELLEAPAAYTFKNKRESERRETNLDGKVRLGDGNLVHCRVLNISAGGALLKPARFGMLPDVFSLMIETEDFEAACEVRHRTGSNVGVMFMSNRRDALLKFG